MVYKSNDCGRTRIKPASTLIKKDYYTTSAQYLKSKYKCSSCGINDAPQNVDNSASGRIARLKYNAFLESSRTNPGFTRYTGNNMNNQLQAPQPCIRHRGPNGKLICK